MKCKTMQIIEGCSFVLAAVCAPLSVGLEKLGLSMAGLIVGSIGAGAIALKAYLSSSPKDTDTVTK